MNEKEKMKREKGRQEKKKRREKKRGGKIFKGEEVEEEVEGRGRKLGELAGCRRQLWLVESRFSFNPTIQLLCFALLQI